MLEEQNIKEGLKNIKKEIEKLAVPDQKEKDYVNSKVKEIFKLIEDEAQKKNLEVKLCGSVAKNTWLKGKREIDIFILFNKKYKKDEMEQITFEICSKIFHNYEIIPASRRYVRAIYEDFEIDVVPIYKISSPTEFVHITDVTPFHVDYVNSKLDDKLRDEVRILKYFLKRINCYGAESYISGLSGYACELLIIHFKSFEECLTKLCSSKPPIYIDIENYYGSYDVAKRCMNPDRLRSPIILIDPVLPERNAAASLSYSTYAKLVFRTLVTINLLHENKTSIKKLKLILELKEKIFDEKILSQLISFFVSLKKKLKDEGFEILEYEAKKESEKIYSIEFYVLNPELSELAIRYGPPIWIKDAVEKFINKYFNNSFGYGIEGTRIYVIYKRTYKNIRDYLYYLLTSSELKNSKVMKYISRWEIVEL